MKKKIAFKVMNSHLWVLFYFLSRGGNLSFQMSVTIERIIIFLTDF